MYEGIKTREDLIDAAKIIEPVEKKIEFITGFFKDNLKYNYMELLIELSLKGGYTFKNNKLTVIPGSFLEKIQDHLENYKGDYTSFKLTLKEIVKEELKRYTLNENEIETNANKFIDYFEDKTRNKDSSDKKIPDFSCVHSLMESDILQPVIDKNGILREGVCRDFSRYFVDILRKSGIPNAYVVGKEGAHEWITIKIGNEYRAMDINQVTRFRDASPGSIDANWCNMDFSDFFKYKPNLEITHFDGMPLKVPINGKNCTQEFISEQFELSTRELSGNTFENTFNIKKLVTKGLQFGVTNEDCKAANKMIDKTKDSVANKENILN